MIILNDNYYITNDTHNIVLRFHEMREKIQKDGTIKQYEVTDDSYHSCLKSALQSFLKRSVNDAESIIDILKRIKEVEEKIDAFFVANKESLA